MKCNCKTLLLLSVREFMSSGSIIPDRDILVLGAGGDKLLPDADIEASDLISVEWSHDVAKLSLNLLPLLLIVAL